MQQSTSSEADRFSVSQEISRILWNRKVHDRFHKRTSPVTILSQLDRIHTPTSHFLRIIFALLPYLCHFLPSGLLPSSFPTKTLYTPLLYPYVLHAPPISFFAQSLCFIKSFFNQKISWKCECVFTQDMTISCIY